MTDAASPVDFGDAGPYPVVIQVDPERGERDRKTVAFRLILAIPHLLLVGGFGVLGWGAGGWDDGNWIASAGGSGVLGAVAGVIAFISWFAIVFTGKQPRGLWDLAAFYLRWKVRAVAYVSLLRDEYPPFGDGDSRYPAGITLEYPETRDRLSVGLRIIYAIPHIIIVALLSVAWAVTTVIAWFAILFTGRYPEGLYDFGMGVMRWSIRLEAYMLLMRDEYPPFSLE